MKKGNNNCLVQYTSPASLLSFIFIGFIILLLPHTAHAMEPIYKVLGNTTSGEGATTLTVWKRLMDLANTFVIVVLIAIAFAQILRINVSTYGVKKLLPALVVAIIAANFSFLFCRLMVDAANAILSIFFSGGVGVADFQDAFTVTIGNPAGALTGGDVFWYIIGQFLIMAAAVVVYILAFLFLVRNWMIYFLVALGPFCIMAMVLPQTKSLFTQWWSNLTKWIFMPIVSVFWLWLGAQWFATSFSSGIWIVNYVFAGFCVYMALTSPFKLGGDVMGKFKQYTQKAAKWGGDRSGINGAYGYLKKKNEVNYAARKQGIYNAVKSTTGLGKGLDYANARTKKVENRKGVLSKNAEIEANKGEKEQADIEATLTLEIKGKEIEAQSKQRFAQSATGKAEFNERLRAQTRTATTDKGTEAVMSAIKRDYYKNANPTNDKADDKLKAEVQSYLNSSADSVLAQAEVEKSEKGLTNKLNVDRLAYQNARDAVEDTQKEIDAAIAAGDARKEFVARGENANAKLAVTAIEAEIDAGKQWAKKGSDLMSATAKSRSKAKVDAMLSEEASVELTKDADTIADEIFSAKYSKMHAQDPSKVRDIIDTATGKIKEEATQTKIDFLAKSKAVDKVLAMRSGGFVDKDAEAMAKKLIGHLGSTAVGMDAGKQEAMVSEIIRKHNEKAGTASQLSTTITDFTALRAAYGGIQDADKISFMTALRSEITQPRSSEKV